MQDCVSEFVSFITSEASEKCHEEKRKTITGEDVLTAMAVLGFDLYLDPLRAYLENYRYVRRMCVQFSIFTRMLIVHVR